VTPAADRYLYRLDPSDTIVFVSPAWLRFAQENDAPELTADNVVGKSLWHFITGSATRTLYVALLRALRERGTEIVVPFHCDAPAQIRHMNLTLRRQSGGAVECEGAVLKVEPRPPVSILNRLALRSTESVPICSVCRRLELHGEWVDLASALVRKPLFNMTPCPRLEETVCPECGAILAQVKFQPEA
jgi:hypothetical protein